MDRSAVPEGHLREFDESNELFSRTSRLLRAAHEAGSEFAVESPADHGDPTDERTFLHQDHAPLWVLPIVIELSKRCGCETATFPMCAFGAQWQKYTTLMFTPGFAAWFRPIARLGCEHVSHEQLAGGSKNESGWNSAATAAYPGNFNFYVAQGVASLRSLRLVISQAERPVQPPRLSATTEDEAAAPLPAAIEQPVPTAAATQTAAPAVSPIRMRPLEDTDAISPEPVAVAPEIDIVPVEPKLKRAPKQVHFKGNDPDIPQWKSLLRPRAALAHERHPEHTKRDGILFRGPRTTISIDARSVGRNVDIGRATLAKKSGDDPANHREAMAADAANGNTDWRDAELKELLNHKSNESFTVQPSSVRPRDRRLVKFTWVLYKTKRNGTKKARLCVQGCTQVSGVDYDQTWCGAMRPTSLRVIASIAAARGWEMRRWDFVSAYLQGELLDGEVVYCSPPPGGLDDSGADLTSVICVVRKPIYGMAQAGRRWQRSLFPWLIEQGFTCCEADRCVFVLQRTMDTPDGPRVENLIIGCYVDDLQIIASHTDEHSLYSQFVTNMQSRWSVEDEGEVTDLLGVEFVRKNDEITLTQTAYIEKMVGVYCPDGVPNLMQANGTPCDRDILQEVVDGLADETPRDPQDTRAFQSIVGALLYCATQTRPDVAYAVGMLCRCMARVTPALMTSAHRVLHYLYVTRELGLRYVASDRPLYGMSDADWAERHSTMGYIFLMHSAAISWSSKKQASVALSTCEAEIVAASEACKEVVHVGGLTGELGEHDGSPIDLFVDNKSAIDLAYNPEHHQRTKHINRRHFYVRELVEDLTIRVPFVASADNLADFFTKPLPAKSFIPMRNLIMNVV